MIGKRTSGSVFSVSIFSGLDRMNRSLIVFPGNVLNGPFMSRLEGVGDGVVNGPA